MTTVADSLDSFKRWTVGAVRVTRVLELPPLVTDPVFFLQASRDDVLNNREWLCPSYANEEGEIFLHFQAFIIEAGGRRIMVDPCIGNDKQRGHALLSMLNTPFLKRLEAAGFPRDSIDYVLCTHLHVDHCGWNTMLVDGRWEPTFPNARYLFARAEFEHSRAEPEGDAPAIYADSVKPIFDAGLAELVDPGHLVVEGVRLEPTPGHTPGHCSIAILSQGRHAMITGDVLHHPLQVAMPHVSSQFCWDCDMAADTRRTLLSRVAECGALMLGTHFAGPTGVHVRADGERWRVEEV